MNNKDAFDLVPEQMAKENAEYEEKQHEIAKAFAEIGVDYKINTPGEKARVNRRAAEILSKSIHEKYKEDHPETETLEELRAIRKEIANLKKSDD